MFAKTMVFITLSLVSVSAFSADIAMPVHIRNSKGQIRTSLQVLKGLNDPNQFESDYFKIVEGTSEVPVSTFADENLRLKAATVYYHLHLARNYFKKTLSRTDHLDEKFTIRIEMDQDYSVSKHFKAPKRLRDVRNIAFTVAASDPDLITIPKPWGTEIWFMKAEKIKQESISHQVTQGLNESGYRSMLAGTLLYQDLSGILAEAQTGQVTWSSHLISMAFSLGVSTVIPTLMEFTTQFFKRTEFFESALVPEAIHHEMGHVALKPWLDNYGSTPITEGFPNFFAGQISGLDRILGKGGKWIKGFGSKKGQAKLLYSLDQEATLMAAHGSFTYALLNDFNEALGDEGIPILVKSLDYLNRNSDLKSDLNYAVQKAAREIAKDPGTAEQAIRNVVRCRFVGCK